MRSPTPYHYHNEDSSRTSRNSSRSTTTPHRSFLAGESPSSYQRNQSLSIYQFADNLEEAFEAAASLDSTITDQQILYYCKRFYV